MMSYQSEQKLYLSLTTANLKLGQKLTFGTRTLHYIPSLKLKLQLSMLLLMIKLASIHP